MNVYVLQLKPWILKSYKFHGFIFVDEWDHAIMFTYKRACFMGLIFVASQFSVKMAKLDPSKVRYLGINSTRSLTTHTSKYLCH